MTFPISRWFSLLLLTLCTMAVQAQVAFAPRFSVNARGDVVFVSNSSMTCPTAAAGCVAAQGASGGTASNNGFNMVYVDIDSDATTINSSSSQLNLTGGSSILWAGLYWAGNSNLATRNQIRLRGPTDVGYVLRTASQVNAIGAQYQSFLDITTLVAAQGNGNYTVADVKSTLGGNQYAGWTIVVAYQNPALPTRNISIYDGYQRVNSATAGGGVNVSLSGFLTPPIGPVNTRVGTIAYDGDRGSTEGTAGLQFGQTASSLSPVFNAANPQTDYFNSTISRDGANISTRNPAHVNTLGYDADISIPNTPLPNGATTAVVRVSSSSETIDLGVVSLVNDIYVPNIKDTLTKKVTDINGGQVLPGDVLEYELTFGNTGQDPALAVVLRDRIPANTTFLPGSILIASGANAGAKTDVSGDDQADFDAVNQTVVVRAGIGANATTGGSVSPGDPFTVVRFRVTINAATPGDTVVDNFGTVTFRAQTLGTVSSDTSDADATAPGDQPARVIVASPDLTIAKSHNGNFFAGQGGVTYSVVVTNSGVASTSGVVTVTESPPTGLSSVSATGVGWSCSGLVCTRSNVLAPGQSYPPLVITANVDLSAPALITNSVSVTGGSEGSSRTGNNSASDPTIIIQGFPVAKSFTPSAVSTGQTSQLQITVRNLSNVTAITGLSVNDPLPAGLVVATPPNASSAGCGALSFAPAASATSLASSGGSVAVNATCTLSVNVVAANAGAYANTIPAGSITTGNAGDSKQAANASLSVSAPDITINKTASGSFFRGQTSGASFSITVGNSGSGTTTGAVTVADTLPTGLLPQTASGTGWNCSIAGQQVTCSRADGLGASSSYPVITIAVTVDASAAASLTNTATVSGGGEPVTNTNNNSSSASVTVLVPPTVTKNFTPSAINLGGTSLLQITISNPNAQAITGLSLTDNYPANLLNTSSPNGASTCTGATVAATPNGSNVQLASATLGANASCTLSVVVMPSAAGGVGGYVNLLPAGAVSTSNAGSSTLAASATLNVSAPDLTISKTHTGSFFPGQTTATFSIIVANNGPMGNGDTIGQITVTDTLPVGLVPTAASGTGWGPGAACSVAGQTVTCLRSDTLSYGNSYPAILVTANVTDAAIGTVTNVASVAGGAEPAANAGNNSASDAVFVLSRPTVSKSFSPSSAALGAAVQLTVVIRNPNAVALTGVSFTDNYPTGLINTASPAASSTCGGAPAAAGSGSSLAITNASIAANGACTVTVNVQATSAGDLINAIPAGALTSANAGSNNVAANATLQAAGADLVISKTHTGSFFQGQTTASFVINVTNQGAGATLGTFQVTDVLPTGLTPVAAGGLNWGPQAGNQCTIAGQTVTCERNLSLAAGASTPLIVTVTVAANAPASLTNTAQVLGGNEPLAAQNNNNAFDNVQIFRSPSVAKAFSPVAASAAQTVTLSITVSNDNPSPISGVGLTDVLPSGLAIVGSAVNTCGGVVNSTVSQISLGGGTVSANNSCRIDVPVLAALPGSYINTIAAASVISSEAGSAQQNAQATLAVAAADLSISKSHNGSFYQGQSPVTYTVVVSNIGSGNTDGSSIVVTDALPLGLTPLNASGSGWACGFSGQTITCSRSGVYASAAVSTITVLASVDVNAPAIVVNTAQVTGGGELTSSNGNNSASDPTTIFGNPLVSKAFNAATVNINQPSVMTVSIRNPNAQAITGLTFNDVYPSGLVNAPVLALLNSCGGTVTATVGGNSLALSGANIPANSTCEVSVQVQAGAAGGYTNSLPSGSVGTANAGGNAQAAQATLNVAGPDLAISKSHVGNFYKNQVGAQFVISVRNIGLGATAGVVTVNDILPGTLLASAISGAGWTCSVSPLQCTRADTLAAGASYPNIVVTVNVSDGAANSETNRAEVSGGGEPAANLANNVATDAVQILGNPSIAKTFTPATINANSPSQLLITLSNPNSTAITGAAFTDNLPAGISTTSAATGTCGGTLATASTAVSLSGGVIPAGGSCEIRVQVTGITPGGYSNVIPLGALTSSNAGNNQITASASLSIAAPDLIVAKSHVGDFYVGQNPAQYSIEVRNVGAGATNGSPIFITDTLPAGLSYLTSSGTNWSCSAAGQVVSCSNSSVLPVGGSLPVLTINVSVQNAAAPSVANTVNVGGGGEPTASAGNNSVTDNTKVLRNPQVAKAFSPTSGNINVPTRLSITLSNSNDTNITGVAFTDTYPGGLVNANPANALSTCGGSVVASAGGSNFQLSGASISANSSCVVEVNVVANAAGNYTNTLAVGSVVSGNAGGNASPTTAFFAAQSPDLTIQKQHAQSFFQGQVGGTFTLKITNIGISTSTGLVTVTDVVPTGMILQGMSGAGWACSAASCIRSDDLPSGASYPDILVTVNIAGNATSPLINTANVSNANEPAANLSNNSAQSAVQVYSSPGIQKTFSPSSMFAGDVSVLRIVLSNTNSVVATNAGFTDNMPPAISVATPANAVSTCGGSVSASGSTVALSGGTIPANGNCEVRVSVSANSPGTHVNTMGAGALSTANTGNSQVTASAALTIASPDLTIAKSHVGNFFQGQNGVTFTLIVTNIGLDASSGTINVTDTFPIGLTPAGASGSGWSCSVTLQVVACSTNVVAAAGSSLSAISIVANVAANAVSGNNSASVSGGAEAASLASNNSATDPYIVLTPIQVSKVFSPNPIVNGQTTSLIVTMSNLNSVGGSIPVSLTDTMPSQITIAGAASASAGCSVSNLNALLGSSVLQVSTATLNPLQSCQITVPVTASAPGAWSNVINPTDVTPNTNAPSVANLVVNAPNLNIVKSHNGTFYAGQQGAVFFLRVTNVGNAATNGSMVAVTDTLPSGLVPVSATGTGWTCAPPSGQQISCTRVGSPTAVISEGGAFQTITVVVNVDSAAAGDLVNSAQVSGGGEVDASNNNASDTVLVLRHLNMTKQFANAAIGPNQTTTLTIRLSNPNPVPVTGIGLTDNFPTAPGSMVVAGVVATNCTGGTAQVIAGNGGITLSGANLVANSACTVTAVVTAATAGLYSNRIPAANLTTSNAGNATQDTEDAITVEAPDLIVKKASLNSPYFLGQTDATFNIVVQNIGNATATAGQVTLQDNFPSGLTPLAAAGSGWVCTISSPSVSCSRDAAVTPLAQGASYPPVIITASVALSASGQLSNTAVVSGGGDNNASNNASTVAFEVLRSPSVSKAFAPSSAQVSQTVQLTIQLINPNAITLFNAAVTDTLPTGLQLSSDPQPISTCGGTVIAAPGANVISLNGGIISPAGCLIRANVIAINPGTFLNLIPLGQLSTANGGVNQQAATASLQISAPDLQIAKKSTTKFWRGQQGGAEYVITVSNIGSGPTNGTVTVQDTIPSGLAVSTVTAAFPWSCSVAGQTVSCVRADTLPVGQAYSDIVLSVRVASDAPLSLVNTARVSGGGEPPVALGNNSADDVTTVLANPVIQKRFVPSSMSLGQVSTLEITVQNSNAVAITDVAVLDAYPTGLVNAATPNASSSCGGTLTAVAGGANANLAAATIAANSICVIKTDITTVAGATPSAFVNTILAGSVTSANAGSNAAGAAATLNVESSDLIVNKNHFGDFYQGQTNAQYQIVVKNQGSGNTAGTVTVSDVLPSSMTVTAITSPGWTCNAVPTNNISCSRTDTLTAGSTWPTINLTVDVSRNANSTVNFASVSGGGESAAAAGNNGASDPTTILSNPGVSKSFSVANTPINTPFDMVFVLFNSNPIAVTGTSITDTFPAGLAFAQSPNIQNACGGSVVANASGFLLTNGVIPASSNCRITASVVVTVTSSLVVNTLQPGALNSANAGNNQQTATASVTGFVTEPTGYKSVRVVNDADNSGNVSAGDTLEWTIVYANAQNGAISRSGFQINDTLPVGVTLTSVPTLSFSGSVTAQVNSGYNGSSSTALLAGGAVLDAGGILTVRIPVRILPNVEGTLSNQATATAPTLVTPILTDAVDNTTPAGSLPSGLVVPSASLPVTQTAGLDATDIIVNIPARIGVAKAVNSVQQINGTTIRVVYDVLVKNFGPQAAPNVQALDNLALTYPAPVSFAVVTAPFVVSGAPLTTNASFNGNGDVRLLQGNVSLASGTSTLIRFAVNVTLSGSQSNFPNSVFVSTLGSGPNNGGNVSAPAALGGLPVFTPPVGAVSTDTSNNATQGSTPAQLETAIDPNGNGRPSDAGEDAPTNVNLAYAAALRGSVWFDATPNRLRDAGEAGVNNFGVELINTITNQAIPCVAGVNSTIGCVTMPDGRSLFATNASGSYEVVGVPVGTYIVRFRDGANNIIYGTPVNGTSNPQSTVTTSRDGLRVNLGAGDALLDQSLPLDPSGVVYNSDPVSRAPIPGAVVTFCGPAGFNALTQLVGGESYTPVPGRSNCAAMTVGALGFYQYLLQPGSPSGQYTLSANAPSFFGPSVVIPPTGTPPTLPPAPGIFAVQPQPVPPTGAQATTYYLVLNLSPSVQDVVHNHIPLDPLGNARLFVTKSVSQRSAEVGDSVEYTISVLSPDTTVNGVSVTDRLPTGFRLIPRTVRIDGVSVADPAGAPGPQMTFNVGTVAQNVAAKISYRVRLGVGSQIGDGINRASANAAGGISSNVAQAVVKVTGGVFTSDGCVVGKIFVDCNRNHTQDAGERGIPGVRLYLEDGTYLISDRDGKYSYCGLTNSTHVIKVDPRTLPEGSRLTTFSNRNVGDASSVLIDMRSGELHRADFVEGSCKPEILEEVEKRRGRAQPLSGTAIGSSDTSTTNQGGAK